MEVRVAQLSGGTTNADRVFVTERAVIVLDGATAFEPVPVGAHEYADQLGRAIAAEVDMPGVSVAAVVADAISHAAHSFALEPGRAPSSTVAILRVDPADTVQLYVLGDSSIFYGNDDDVTHVVDSRLSQVATVERDEYVHHLAAGSGYNSAHRERLAALQRAQRSARNVSGGYWIAEADPRAAHHAYCKTVPVQACSWALLASDGAADGIEAGGPPPSVIAGYDQERLKDLLHEQHQWEADQDPDGRIRPRAKRHDDKTLAAVRITV